MQGNPAGDGFGYLARDFPILISTTSLHEHGRLGENEYGVAAVSVVSEENESVCFEQKE